jgi:hypothetical protein
MDVLKVFNLIVCADKKLEGRSWSSTWFFNLVLAPIGILWAPTKFAILGWFTIFIFFILIYTSQSSLMKVFNTDAKGNMSWINSLFSAIALYIFQTTIILLFLRFSICEKTLDWESNDFHLTLQQYNNESFKLDTKSDGY